MNNNSADFRRKGVMQRILTPSPLPPTSPPPPTPTGNVTEGKKEAATESYPQLYGLKARKQDYETESILAPPKANR